MLNAYRLKLRTASREHYHDELMLWATLAPHLKKANDPPPLPAILAAD